MESILYKIKNLYNEMGKAEKKIADYIFTNSQSLLNCSITDLSKKSNCGTATIVRFSRRLGFKGYPELKYAITLEMESTSKIDTLIHKNDDCFNIFRKQIRDIDFTLKNTECLINPESLNLAAEKIMHADRIVIFGLGNSASIAKDAEHKFLRLGLNAQACNDNHMQAIIASHLNRKSVAIGISHSGESKDIIEALELSKIGSAHTIGITNNKHTTIIDVCDTVLFTNATETKHSVLALSSRIAQLAIIDAIYTYIVMHSSEESHQAIYNTEYSLKSKKIKDD